jgi:hypothetical protein
MENDKITTSFHKFKAEQANKQTKKGEYNQLADDISILRKLDDGEYEKIDEPVEIIKIIDIIRDEDEITKLETFSGGFNLTSDIAAKELKRGDTIWLTALLKRPNSSSSYNQSVTGTLKCRIVDLYYGYNKLKYT